MSSPNQQHQPSPELFFETINAYQKTACLKGAIELDLFTKIGEGAATAAAIAQACGASERGTRILCDYLVIAGFLTKNGKQYALTLDSAVFLSRRSPAYMGSAATFLVSKTQLDNFSDVAAIVRKGGTVAGEEGNMAPEHPIWVEFARTMAPMMAMPAEAIAGLLGADAGQPCKVLDIAAGHGVFGITIAKHNAHAEITGLDWSNVLTVARENAKAAGVESRYRTIEGSAFEAEFGTGYDVVLLTNFLHHFDPATCEELLRKVHASLKPGGRAVTLEFVPNEDRVSPPSAASFSMMMLGTTPAGDAYTFAEFASMFRNAGFAESELHVMPNAPEQIIISRR